MKKLIICAGTAMTAAVAATGHAENAQPHGYLIANYEIVDQETYAEYMQAAEPLAAPYGGRIIIFNLSSTGLEGDPKSVMAIAEFPSLADAARFYNSPEYSEARKLRIASTEGTVVLTEGFVPPER